MLFVSPKRNTRLGLCIWESANWIFRNDRKYCVIESYFTCSSSKVRISSSAFSKLIFGRTVFWSRKNNRPPMIESNYMCTVNFRETKDNLHLLNIPQQNSTCLVLRLPQSFSPRLHQVRREQYTSPIAHRQV